MSDDEREVSDEEVEEEEEKQPPKVEEPKKPVVKKREEPPQKEISEAELALEQKMKKKKEEEEQMWIEYMEQRKVQKIKEEEDLRKLKERQMKRKERRKEEEKKLLALRKQQEAQRIKEMEEKKAREAEAKKKRLEEAERKRQAMQDALQKNKMEEPVTPNFVITKRNEDGSLIPATFNKIPTSLYIKSEMAKTKEQLAEDKKIALAVRVKPLELEGLQPPELKSKAAELWDAIVKLESEVYDLEEHRKRQEYDLKELSERQRQINRSKALKKGLDPDALSGKFPPMINVASKYERRLDRRNFGDKKSLFEGGYMTQIESQTESEWENKMKSFKERPSKLPKWDPDAAKNKEKPQNTEPIEEEEDDLGPNPFLPGAELESVDGTGSDEKKEEKPETNGENAEEEEGEEEEDEEEEEEEEEEE